jgi:hypothetical protein
VVVAILHLMPVATAGGQTITNEYSNNKNQNKDKDNAVVDET